MKILYLHGWHSSPGGKKATCLREHGYDVIAPELSEDDFDAAVRSAQSAFDLHKPDVVVGSSRGGAVAMNINIGETRLVLLCPAWKNWGAVSKVTPNAVILHSRDDEVIPFSDSQELTGATLIEVGKDHRLGDPESLAMMLKVVENATG